MQVLYFIPGMRRIMLEVPPDPADEFSLLDETALLFRMLLAGGPEACQATNLLRALRQNKGAAALGLLETHEQRSGENSDIEVIAYQLWSPYYMPTFHGYPAVQVFSK